MPIEGIVVTTECQLQLKCYVDKYFSDAFEGCDYSQKQMPFIHIKKKTKKLYVLNSSTSV